MFRQRAKENLSEGGKIGADITNRGCQTSDKAVDTIDTKKELAKIAGVSHDTISKAKKIIEKADLNCRPLVCETSTLTS
jgi:peroxiredoxin